MISYLVFYPRIWPKRLCHNRLYRKISTCKKGYYYITMIINNRLQSCFNNGSNVKQQNTLFETRAQYLCSFTVREVNRKWFFSYSNFIWNEIISETILKIKIQVITPFISSYYLVYSHFLYRSEGIFAIASWRYNINTIPRQYIPSRSQTVPSHPVRWLCVYISGVLREFSGMRC